MTSGSKKKKNRKAAKKKKKKQLCSQGINIHSPPTALQEHDDLDIDSSPICNGGDHIGLHQEEHIGCSSAVMEGSGNDGGKEVVVEAVKDVESVGIEHGEEEVKELGDGGEGIVEKIESLDEGVSEKSAYDPVEKVISSVSEEINKLVGEIPVLEETMGKFIEDVPIEKIKESGSGVLEWVSKEVGDRGISFDLHKVGSSHTTEDESKEPDEESSNLPIVPPVLKRSTWKSCCGMFE